MDKEEIPLIQEIEKIKPKENINDTVKILKESFDKFEKYNDSISEINFFNYFPNNINQLIKIYGFIDINTDSTYRGPLYEYYYKHIDEYYEENKRKYVSDEHYYEKLVKVCVNAKWDADAVGAIQHILINELEKNNYLVYYLISKNKDRLSIWKFIFDVEDFKINEFNQIIKNIEDENYKKDITKLYELSRKEWDEDH